MSRETMIFFEGILRGVSKNRTTRKRKRRGDYTTRLHGNMVDYFP
jgi:hypothetical protein